MKHYELLTILPGTMSEDEVAPIAEKIKAILVDGGAEQAVVESKGKNRLAYPIKHIRYGYFHFGHFQAEPAQAVDIQRRVRLVEGLLRSLVQIYDPATQNTGKMDTMSIIESIEALSREDRNDRDRSNHNMSNVVAQAVVVEQKNEVPVEKVVVVEAPVKVDPEKPITTVADKVSMEEIDKKLDEILSGDIVDV